MKYIYTEFNVLENDLILFPFFVILGTKFIVFKVPRTDRPLPENVDLSSPFVTFHMMTSPDVSPAANVNV